MLIIAMGIIIKGKISAPSTKAIIGAKIDIMTVYLKSTYLTASRRQALTVLPTINIIIKTGSGATRRMDWNIIISASRNPAKATFSLILPP